MTEILINIISYSLYGVVACVWANLLTRVIVRAACESINKHLAGRTTNVIFRDPIKVKHSDEVTR